MLGFQNPDESQGSLSYCGVPNQVHPDRKPMGYPFDRNMDSEDVYLHHFMSKSRNPKETLSEFDEPTSERISNMKVVNIIVKHSPGAPVNGSTINPNYAACQLKDRRVLYNC